MRVVAGRARGRVLQAPPGLATRPTRGRVREAVFNILSSMDVIEGAPVVDLFAGSGALGIEALSRGAASVTFVDRDRAATDAIRANLARLGDEARLGRVVAADAVGWVRRLAPGTRAGLVFADPPYGWGPWDEVLAALLPVTDLLVAETGAPLDAGAGWETVRSRRYGGTVVTFLRPLDPPGRGTGRGPRTGVSSAGVLRTEVRPEGDM